MSNKQKYKYKKKYKKNKKSGFSLIEITIVIALTIILSSSFIAYTTTVRSRNQMFVESSKLLELILKAKALALATYDEDNPPPPCAYGIWIKYADDAYALIRYNQDPATGICPDIGPPPKENRFNPDLREVVPNEEYKLPSGVTFRRCNVSGSPKIRYILFEPPNPNVWLYRNRPCPGGRCPLLNNPQGGIYILSQDRKAELLIEVNQAGQVTIKNSSNPICNS